MFNRKPDKFLLYLDDFAKHLHQTMEYFVYFKIKNPETLVEIASTIKKYETKPYVKVHKIIKDLNETFITTIEREDILELTTNLDDIIDGMEEFTALMDIYQILSSNKYMDQFTEYISKSTDELLTAIELIANSKLGDI